MLLATYQLKAAYTRSVRPHTLLATYQLKAAYTRSVRPHTLLATYQLKASYTVRVRVLLATYLVQKYLTVGTKISDSEAHFADDGPRRRHLVCVSICAG